MPEQTRRDCLLHMLFGTGAIGLRSLVTGIPISILANPYRAAMAQATGTTVGKPPQYVIFSTSGSGDPINANVPGTYTDPNINHSNDPSMAATPMTVGTQSVVGAQIWSTLPAAMLAQTTFFHHQTMTSGHGDEPKILKLAGASNGDEMLPSMLATNLSATLKTVRKQPINLAPDAITSGGQLLPAFSPSSLAATLSLPKSPISDANLVTLRDKSLDALYAVAKTQGKQFQKDFIDQYALSQTQVRTIQSQVLSQLTTIKGNDAASQVKAAIILFKLNVTPTVVVRLPFGGDNHNDAGFNGSEVPQHKSSVAVLASLPQALADAGLTGKVTFASANVFGRNLGKSITTRGRDHNPNHAVSLIVGSNITGGVVGGVVAKGTGHTATAIDSATGASNPSGDIVATDTLASFGKTLAAAVGVPPNLVDSLVLRGKTVAGVLA